MAPRFPDGRQFAFTIIDDTDVATVENVAPMYALLERLGMRTTKTVWPVGCPEGSADFGSSETMEDPADQTPEIDLAPEPDAPYVPRWVQGDGSIDCPDAFPIKAKVNSNIYYEPGTYHYSVAIPDVCFAAPEDAASAGYRAPRR